MWLLLGQCMHLVCDEGEVELKGFQASAVTGSPQAWDELAVTVGRQLFEINRFVDRDTVLLLEASAATMEPILDALRVARWSLRRILSAGDRVFVEGRKHDLRRLKSRKLEGDSLADVIPAVMAGKAGECPVLVDPFASDLSSLRGAESAGMHSISISVSPSLQRYVSAAECSLKVELEVFSWTLPFLLDLIQNQDVRAAARAAKVSPARIYQASENVEEFRLAVNAIRTGLRREALVV